MVFEIEMEDFRRKIRLVAGGHIAKALATIMHASIVSRETGRTDLMIATCNDLEVIYGQAQTRCGPLYVLSSVSQSLFGALYLISFLSELAFSSFILHSAAFNHVLNDSVCLK